MDNIYWVYFICLFCVVLVVYAYFSKSNFKEGNSGKKDTCEYELHVAGLIKEIDRPELILFGANILEPVSGIVDMINEMIKMINLVIIAIDFFANKFIGCLLFFFLHGIGLALWGLILAIFGIIGMKDLPDNIHTWLNDNVDEPLYTYTGMHLIHFPTIINNRCYHWDGKDREPCWKSPFEKDGEDGSYNNGIANDSAKNKDFYNLLCSILTFLFVGLCLYAAIYKVMSFFSPSVKCEGASCKK